MSSNLIFRPPLQFCHLVLYSDVEFFVLVFKRRVLVRIKECCERANEL